MTPKKEADLKSERQLPHSLSEDQWSDGKNPCSRHSPGTTRYSTEDVSLNKANEGQASWVKWGSKLIAGFLQCATIDIQIIGE